MLKDLLPVIKDRGKLSQDGWMYEEKERDTPDKLLS